jgi:hypothetical protein
MRWPHSIACLGLLVLFVCDPGALGQQANGIFVVPVPNAPFIAISLWNRPALIRTAQAFI